jgi:glutamyl-tRNA synthetase
VIVAAGDRIKVAGDVLAFPEFFQNDDPLAYDEQAFEKHLREGDGSALLAKFRERLATVEPFDVPTLESLMQGFVADEQIKIGQIIHPVRVAVTGKSVGLGLFDTLAILGQQRCLRRIDRAMARA